MNMLEIGRDDGSGGEYIITKIKIEVKSGLNEERVVEIDLEQPAEVILAVVASERGCRVEELLLIREGETNPISGQTPIGRDYPHHRRHHVHSARDIEVIVYYQAGSHRRTFKRFESVEVVLDWAITAFGIDPTMAPEFELAQCGTEDELPLSEHLGHLAGQQDCLELNLIRTIMPNG